MKFVTLKQFVGLFWFVIFNHLVSAAPALIPTAPKVNASGYLLMDSKTGKVLVEHNATEKLPPASLTKMMTSYIAAVEIGQGNISLDDMVHVSVKAWRMGGSKMFIREGTQVRLEDLLRGVIIQSGNDASVAVAEHIAGSEEAFAGLMNQHAIALGMKNTNFINSTGWPAENHYTTAKDLSLLSKALIERYPDHYALYSEKTFEYGGIIQRNRNALLWQEKLVDGVKTGHTEEAGFCLIASAKRINTRLISVVMGASSEKARARESQKLLSYGFRYWQTHRLYGANEVLNESTLWAGEKESVKLGLGKPIFVTIPRGQEKNLSAMMNIDEYIKAPITKGQQFGVVNVSLHEKPIYEGRLVALEPINEAGFFSRIWHAICLFFIQLFN